MLLPNKVYDILKWIVITFMPAAMALVAGLGIYLDFDTNAIVGIMGLVTTFFGTLIGVSSVRYKMEEDEDEGSEDN